MDEVERNSCQQSTEQSWKSLAIPWLLFLNQVFSVQEEE